MGRLWGVDFDVLACPPITSPADLPWYFGAVADNVAEMVAALGGLSEWASRVEVAQVIRTDLDAACSDMDAIRQHFRDAAECAAELYSELPDFRKVS